MLETFKSETAYNKYTFLCMSRNVLTHLIIRICILKYHFMYLKWHVLIQLLCMSLCIYIHRIGSQCPSYPETVVPNCYKYANWACLETILTIYVKLVFIQDHRLMLHRLFIQMLYLYLQTELIIGLATRYVNMVQSTFDTYEKQVCNNSWSCEQLCKHFPMGFLLYINILNVFNLKGIIYLCFISRSDLNFESYRKFDKWLHVTQLDGHFCNSVLTADILCATIWTLTKRLTQCHLNNIFNGCIVLLRDQVSKHDSELRRCFTEL